MGLSSLPPVPGVSYKREVFLASSTFTLPVTAFNKFDCVLVSGGGGGGKGDGPSKKVQGGRSAAAYFHDIFCTNGTVLTVTVGAGGAGATVNTGTVGTASTITGIAGNGASTSLSSGAATAGLNISSGGLNVGQTTISPQVAMNLGGTGYRAADNAVGGSKGLGFGVMAFASGANSQYGPAQSIFGTNSDAADSGANKVRMGRGGTGGPIPLLGSLLHATAGATGGVGPYGDAGGTSYANTYFAGSGGNSYYNGQTNRKAGNGGGGGGGGLSPGAAYTSGVGGAGSVNSGGGGGASGRNIGGAGTNTGVGGNGGSGFIVIGYWG